MVKKIVYYSKKEFLITNCRRLKKCSFFKKLLAIEKDKNTDYRKIIIEVK